jgi:hypothetical protein
LSKSTFISPCHKTSIDKDLTLIFFQTVFRHQVMPRILSSDNGPQFISEFWRELFFYWVPRSSSYLHIIHNRTGVKRSLIRLSLKPFVGLFQTVRPIGMNVFFSSNSPIIIR